MNLYLFFLVDGKTTNKSQNERLRLGRVFNAPV